MNEIMITRNKLTCQFAVVMTVLVSIGSAAGQQKVFKWSDELCDYQGTYNAKKYTAAQLRNTERLLRGMDFDLTKTPMVFNPADISKLDLAGLEKEYAEKSAELRALDIVPVPYWQTIRDRQLATMKQVYDLARVTIRGFGDRSALNEAAGSQTCKVKFASPLIAGGDQLIEAWRKLNIEQRKNNGDPARVKREFDTQLASADAQTYALVDVMMFGWWNCMNADISRIDYDGTQEREFKKLFIRTKKVSCSEP